MAKRILRAILIDIRNLEAEQFEELESLADEALSVVDDIEHHNNNAKDSIEEIGKLVY